MDYQKLLENFANTDLDVIDQLLKRRIPAESKILDAGCGEGRNLTYFIKNEYPVWAIDSDPLAVKYCQYYGKSIRPEFNSENILTDSIEEMLFPSSFFDVVFCINVIHAIPDNNLALLMLKKLSQVLKPGGYLLLKYKLDILQKLDIGQWFDLVEPEKTIMIDGEKYLFQMLTKKAG